MTLELWWGKLRRTWLRWFRPGYVRRMEVQRQGDCPDCPHQIVDPRDLKYYRNVCGFWFRKEDDPFLWRDRLGLARVGLGEVVILSSLFAILLAGLLLGWYYAGLTDWLVWPLVAVIGLCWLEVLWFFRDPNRSIPDDPAALVSPADGTVVDIGPVDDPDFPGGQAFRIAIFLSVFDVHVNRLPRSGQVVELRYFPGKFHNALRGETAARENEQLWIDLEEPGNRRRIRVKQIAGLIARRIVCWLRLGSTVLRGERLGMIKMGSRTEVLIPTDVPVKVAVRVGQKVKGGATTLLHYEDERRTGP
jgi:phosphatidylserine decarboxylase